MIPVSVALEAAPGSTPSADIQIADGSAVETLAGWRGLAASATNDSPFLAPEWFAIWTRHFSRRPLSVVIARREGAVVGLLPIVRGRSWWKSPTNAHTPEFDALVADDDALLALAQHLARAPVDRIELTHLPAESRLLEALSAHPSRRCLRRIVQRSPFLAAAGRSGPLPSTASARLLRDLRRRERNLSSEGTVTLDVVRGPTRLEAALQEAFAVEASGWKGEAGTAISSRPETRGFYTDIARWAAETGVLRIAFLRVADKAIAMQMGLVGGGTYHFLKGGFDRQFHRYAPSKLLLRTVLEQLPHEGVSRFRFHGEAEAWKCEWTDTIADKVAVEAFANTPAGILAAAAVRVGRPVGKRAKAALRRATPRGRRQ